MARATLRHDSDNNTVNHKCNTSALHLLLLDKMPEVLIIGEPLYMGDAMAPDRNQVSITLSDRAMEEYTLVAEWLGMPRNTLIRQVIEDRHQSPAFGNLVRRAKSANKAHENIKFPVEEEPQE